MMQNKLLCDYSSEEFKELIRIYKDAQLAWEKAIDETPPEIWNEIPHYIKEVTENIQFALRILRQMMQNAKYRELND